MHVPNFVQAIWYDKKCRKIDIFYDALLYKVVILWFKMMFWKNVSWLYKKSCACCRAIVHKAFYI